MRVAIIDYGLGNLRSVQKSFEYVGSKKKYEIWVGNDYKELQKADYIVLPGVGSFGDCIAGLGSLGGVKDTLIELVLEKKRPFLGICVGMQLMVEHGFEYGRHEGLGWLSGDVKPLSSDEKPILKIPHMGWNELNICQEHPVLEGLAGKDVYFVHSFAVNLENENNMYAKASYGQDFCAVMGKDNMIGTQFHPEKSQEVGLKLISNFLEWSP